MFKVEKEQAIKPLFTVFVFLTAVLDDETK